jgi:hypothetical protein
MHPSIAITRCRTSHIWLFRSSVGSRKTDNKRKIENETVMQFLGEKKIPLKSDPVHPVNVSADIAIRPVIS